MTNNLVLNKEISLKEFIFLCKKIFNYLLRKWVIIFGISLLFSIIGLTYAIIEKTKYKANLTFALDEDKGGAGGGLMSAMGIANSLGIDLGGVSSSGAFASTNLIELMKSRLIVEQSLLDEVTINEKKITLAELYIQTYNLRKSWQGKPKVENLSFPINCDRKNFTLQQDSILQIIYNDIVDDKLNIFQKDKKITIYSIEVLSQNELFSKFLCEKISKEVTNFYIDTKTRKTRNNLFILQKQLDSVRGELDESLNIVASRTDNVFNLNPSLNVKTIPGKKRQIDVQANSEILKQLITQVELSKITLRKETPLIQVIDTPILPLKKYKNGKFRSLVLGGILGFIFSVVFLTLRLYIIKILK